MTLETRVQKHLQVLTELSEAPTIQGKDNIKYEDVENSLFTTTEELYRKFMQDGSYSEERVNVERDKEGLIYEFRYLAKITLLLALKIDKELEVKEVITELNNTYYAKNRDYGDSFSQSLDNFGLLASVVRLSDKYNRAKTQLNKDYERLVEDESLKDTLLDAVNYCVMTVLWLSKQ